MLFIRERQLPRMVNLPEHPEVFIPLRLSQAELDLTDSNFEYTAIARLRRGVALEQARAEIEAAGLALSQQSRWNFEIHARLEPLLAALVGNTRKGLLVLLGAVGFMLMIVCVNVANLTLVRATHRRRELAIRTALGAGKRHLAGQSLVESALLAVSGTLLGLLMALWIMDFLIARLRVQLPRLEGVALDSHVLAVAVGLCLLTTILFGMLPALCAAGVSPQEAIQTCSRGNTDGPRGGRLRAVLVSAEVALSTLLLIGAGLLLSSLQRVMHATRGFQSENIVSVDLSLPSSRYETMQLRTAFFRRLSEAVHSLPGVLHAGYISSMPLSGEWGWRRHKRRANLL
jgi:putative ABC transport system permease protein